MPHDSAETQASAAAQDMPSKPGVWTVLWRISTRFDSAKLQPWIALRNALGISLPLAIGATIGVPGSGLVASTGALNVAFTDGSDPYYLRAQRMVAASALTAFAVLTGAICGGNDLIAICAATLWAAGAGLLIVLDVAAADIGLISLITLVVFSGQPMSPDQAVAAGLLALGGGLLQTALAVALWPLRRDEPERRVLAALFREISRFTGSRVTATSAPPASAQSTQARKVLSGLWLSRTIQGERYLSLLNQAERIRLGFLALSRVRVRLGREQDTNSETSILDQCFQTTSRILAAVADSLETGRTGAPDPEWLQALQKAGEALRGAAERRRSLSVVAMIDDARHQVDALAGQLRAVIHLGLSSSPSGREVFERVESERPWRLRLAGTFATLTANLTPRSAAFQHAVRLSICVALGEIAARVVEFGRGYWIPLTIAIVLKPDFTATFSRGLLRIFGTFAGLVLATLLFHFTVPAPWVEVLLIAILGFVLRCYGPANYGILVIAVSAMVVLMMAIVGTNPSEVIDERGWSTVIGGLLALATYAAWPTWERAYVANTLATLLDAYRAYFRVVRESYEYPDRSYARELDHVRMEARLARSNLEASVERFAAEPGASDSALHLLNAMLASSHRLVHTIMALEAGLSRSQPVPARPEFSAFANQVEVSLHSIAGALRGSHMRVEELPDLRDSHHALVQSGDPAAARYAWVNVETDRMTNSLNTLTGQALEWALRAR
jgi:uncharacterized membrane protein YccC